MEMGSELFGLQQSRQRRTWRGMALDLKHSSECREGYGYLAWAERKKRTIKC